VLEELWIRLPVTLEIAIFATLVSSLIAIPLGTLAAIHQDTWPDYVVRLVSIGGLAPPSLWGGILIILFLVIFFQWNPPLEFVSPLADPWENCKQLVWPILSVGCRYAAVTARMTRSTVLEVMREDYIRTAWAKGLRDRMVVVKHTLTNAMLPVITIVGAEFAFLIGGLVVTETVFTLNGVGSFMVDAIAHRDIPVVQALVLLTAFVFVVINLTVDLLYACLDLKVSYRSGGADDSEGSGDSSGAAALTPRCRGQGLGQLPRMGSDPEVCNRGPRGSGASCVADAPPLGKDAADGPDGVGVARRLNLAPELAAVGAAVPLATDQGGHVWDQHPIRPSELREVQAVYPDYCLREALQDGWQLAEKALQAICPQVVLGQCHLHPTRRLSHALAEYHTQHPEVSPNHVTDVAGPPRSHPGGAAGDHPRPAAAAIAQRLPLQAVSPSCAQKTPPFLNLLQTRP
jgi:peptide/nickel transport system permease protein